MSSKIAIGGYGGTLPTGAHSGRIAVMSPASQPHVSEKIPVRLLHSNYSASS